MPDPDSPGSPSDDAGEPTPENKVRIRPIAAADLAQVIAIDAEASGIEHRDPRRYDLQLSRGCEPRPRHVTIGLATGWAISGVIAALSG